MLDNIQEWAKTQSSVKVVLLTSSRARKNGVVDQLSDYDIEFYVTDTTMYTTNNDWLQSFGEVLILLPEKRILLGTEQPTRLVIYKDGTKVDFTIADISLLQQIIALPSLPEWLDDGYRVVFDKDDITARMKKPSYMAYIPAKPSEKEYRDLVHEFWWETTYVAKYLWREEILPAKFSSDCVIRNKVLLKMLEWYVQVKRDWKCRIGYAGKGIKSLLDTTEWEQLKSIFPGADVEDNWRALFSMIRVFRKISMEVGNGLGYEYPRDLDENVEKYIISIRGASGADG
jgi:aminoglycoside 6-adenylyltransferase